MCKRGICLPHCISGSLFLDVRLCRGSCLCERMASLPLCHIFSVNTPFSIIALPLSGTENWSIVCQKLQVSCVTMHIWVFAHARPSVDGSLCSIVGGQRWAGSRKLQAGAVSHCARPQTAEKFQASPLVPAPSLSSVSLPLLHSCFQFFALPRV